MTLELRPDPVIIEGHDLVIPGISIYRDRLSRAKNKEMVTIRGTNIVLESPKIFGSKPYAQGYRADDREAEHGIGLHGAHSVKIIKPIIHNVCGDFIYLAPRGWEECTDITIEEPDFFNSGRHGIAALGIDGLTVTGPGRIHGFRRAGVDTERQFGARSKHTNLKIDRTMVASWRKLKAQKLL